jgi:hypothetical protein
MKPNAIVGEIGYRLKIADTKKHIPLLAKLETDVKKRGYLKSVTGKMEAGQGIAMYLKSLKFTEYSVFCSAIN